MVPHIWWKEVQNFELSAESYNFCYCCDWFWLMIKGNLLHDTVVFERHWAQQANWLRPSVKPADMHLGIACGFFCFFVLMASSSWSWELSQFYWVKSDNDELLCGMSPPNKTLNDVGSRAECVSKCFHVCPSPCDAVNYWKNTGLCQHFYYLPSFEVHQDCINYINQVTIVEFWIWCSKSSTSCK